MDEPYRTVIKRLLEALKEKYGDRLVSVVLFGSVARGEARKDSDIDILLVVENLPKSRVKRQEEFLEIENRMGSLDNLMDEGYMIDFSPIIRTPEEIIRFPPILLDLVEDGVILYDKNEFFKNILERMREKMRELGSKRVRMGKKWFWVLKPDYKFGEVIKIE